jgi:hypothetical protein
MMNLDERWKLPEEGLWGFSHCAFYDSWYPWSGAGYPARIARLVDDLAAAQANSFRPHIHRHRVEPFVGEVVKSPADVTAEMVDACASGTSGALWSDYDLMIDALREAGIEPHVVLGAAYDFQLPWFDGGYGAVRATPDNLGRDRYLGCLYLHARAAVRRYRGRVRVWQLENELNVAGETMIVMRWRSGRSWLDRGFLRAIMELLGRAVRGEDETALTSHNFHTDARVLKGLYDWRSDVEAWLEYLDVVGVDCYPNYLLGVPCRGRVVGRKVAEAVAVSDGRPVMVLESGYPVRPGYRGYGERRQAGFVREALTSASEAGAAGFYYYEICSPEGFTVEGPWSNRFLQGVEPWWGLIRTDDTRRPAYYEFARAAARFRSGGG